jgi:uncharacterized protein (TIGR03435 family)
MHRRFLLLFGAAVLAAAQPTAFEVASIKVHPEPVTLSVDPSVRGSRMTGTASTLLDMITTAYGVKYEQVSGGPGWVTSIHYDLNAMAPGDARLTQEQAKTMLQNLLADRFQLKIHREQREIPVYALVVGKNGHKLKASTARAKGDNYTRSDLEGMHMEATRGTMERLATQLSASAGRPVQDRTGLTGYFAFKLDWLPANRIPEADSERVSLFTAIQEQLGLKLEPSKGPIEMLIIDRAEKPTEN